MHAHSPRNRIQHWMHRLLLVLTTFAVTHLPAVQVGDTRAAVLAEKGAPLGRMETASLELLKYPDVSLKLRNGRVIAIDKPVASSPREPAAPVSPSPQPSPSTPTATSSAQVNAASYLIYVPAGMEPDRRYPLVFALSPSGDAPAMIATWSAVADRHRWIVVASKDFKNGQKFSASLAHIESTLNEVELAYPVDRTRVIFTGFSGGGMAAHAVAQIYPERVHAVVINTGMIHPEFATGTYPPGKTAVFIASPTDFRYEEMKRDQAFLEGNQWKTRWLEFDGGHALAPAAVYEQAAAALEQAFD